MFTRFRICVAIVLSILAMLAPKNTRDVSAEDITMAVRGHAVLALTHDSTTATCLFTEAKLVDALLQLRGLDQDDNPRTLTRHSHRFYRNRQNSPRDEDGGACTSQLSQCLTCGQFVSAEYP